MKLQSVNTRHRVEAPNQSRIKSKDDKPNIMRAKHTLVKKNPNYKDTIFTG